MNVASVAWNGRKLPLWRKNRNHAEHVCNAHTLHRVYDVQCRLLTVSWCTWVHGKATAPGERLASFVTLSPSLRHRALICIQHLQLRTLNVAIKLIAGIKCICALRVCTNYVHDNEFNAEVVSSETEGGRRDRKQCDSMRDHLTTHCLRPSVLTRFHTSQGISLNWLWVRLRQDWRLILPFGKICIASILDRRTEGAITM